MEQRKIYNIIAYGILSLGIVFVMTVAISLDTRNVSASNQPIAAFLYQQLY